MPRSPFCSVLVLILTAQAAFAQNPAPLYHLAATWKIPGEGGWNQITVDAGARRLYVARQDRVQVVNADTGELAGEVTGLNGAQGIALAPRLGRGFVTCGGSNTLVVFDLKTLTLIGEPVAVGEKPDAVVYVPGRDKVFVFNGGGANASVLDAKEGRPLGTVALGGKPAFAVAEGGGRVFVNLEDTNEVVAIDAETLAIENRYALKTETGKAPMGLSLDPDGGRLFVGCGNEKMVVMATEDGTIMSTPTIGEGVGATGFDLRTKLALAANGVDGTLTVVDAYKASPKAVGTVATRPGARTLAVDQKTHAVYVAASGAEGFVILKYDYDGTRK